MMVHLYINKKESVLRIDTELDETLLDILRRVVAKAGLPPWHDLYDFRPYNDDEDLDSPVSPVMNYPGADR